MRMIDVSFHVIFRLFVVETAKELGDLIRNG